MNVITDLVNKIENEGWTLRDIMLSQHSYHESRRWSVDDILKKYQNNDEAYNFTKQDKAALWHTVQGETTTQPGGLTIAMYADKLSKEYKNNPTVEIILKSLEAWLARYWLNEESHHEVAFSKLGDLAKVKYMTDEEIINHRQHFPDDKIGRKLMLQACVETEVTLSYSNMAKSTSNPLLKEVFTKIMQDEAQHRLYFISFAKALVDKNIVPEKDILSMIYSWIRPGGDTYSTERKEISKRDSYVNWWETVDHNNTYKLDEEQYKNKEMHDKKESSIFQMAKFTLGLDIKNVEELKQAYFYSLSSSKKSA